MSKKESPMKTIVVAVVLSLVCSIVVSFAAIKLKPLQELNKELDRKRNILISAQLLEDQSSADVEELFKQIETKVVDLSTGEFVEPPKDFNQRKFAKDPKTNKVLGDKQDIAGIGKRSQLANVYLVRDDNNNVETIILPVHGYGLWSTMYGFLALKPDTTTVVGFKYYEQGETAGLGGEVENPSWRAKWPGKEVLNKDGEPVIELVKGNAQDKNHVDGLSGATLTSNGVENTLHYWLGEDGFGPFLARVRAGEI